MSFIINGQELQHATIDFSIAATGGSFQLTTFKKLSYKVSAPKKPTNNAKGNIDGFTIDKKVIDASISLRLSEYFRAKDWLLAQYAAFNLGMGQIQFDAPVTYGNSLTNLRTDRLYGVMFNEDPRESEDNQDVLVVDIPLFVMNVVDSNGFEFINYNA